MKIKELVKKNNAELVKTLSEKRTALRDFRFSVSGSNVRNVKEGKVLKKDIARILTLLNKKA
ncbi:MAG TPA: 50S ribosomal protein L29 [Parcubacteria group bacterium]|jgi:ribosomal protein L29|nr:50S ribosomal protein L29 [Parcubacteria group bacterium]